MQGLIFIAPPAAGKGTQSELICKKYGYKHISTGKLLREYSKKDSLEAMYVKEKIDSGELVDDDLVASILKEKLDSLNCDFILDGFPRDINQAEILDKILINSNYRMFVFHIDTPFNVVMKRFTGRLTCPNCGMVYNKFVQELKPINDGYCNVCKGKLVVRNDDNEETFTKRFETYANETQPLIDFYKRKGCLFHIDGIGNKDQIFKQISRVLEGDCRD